MVNQFKRLSKDQQEAVVQRYVLDRMHDLDWMMNRCCEVVKKDWLANDDEYVTYVEGLHDLDETQTGE